MDKKPDEVPWIVEEDETLWELDMDSPTVKEKKPFDLEQHKVGKRLARDLKKLLESS